MSNNTGQRRKRNRRGILLSIGAGVVILFTLPFIFTSGSKGSAQAASAGQTPLPPVSTSQAPSVITNPSASAATVTRMVKRVTFKVWGSAPSGADITYGSDSDNRSPQGGMGLDGSGTAVPWHASIKLDPSALYWVVNAQLNGGGDISCSVGVKVTAYYSDGTHVSRSKVLARGHASGGYNICSAQSS